MFILKIPMTHHSKNKVLKSKSKSSAPSNLFWTIRIERTIKQKHFSFQSSKRCRAGFVGLILKREAQKYFRNLDEILESSSTLRLLRSQCAFRPTDGKVSSLSARCQSRIFNPILTVASLRKEKNINP